MGFCIDPDGYMVEDAVNRNLESIKMFDPW